LASNDLGRSSTGGHCRVAAAVVSETLNRVDPQPGRGQAGADVIEALRRAQFARTAADHRDLGVRAGAVDGDRRGTVIDGTDLLGGRGAERGVEDAAVRGVAGARAAREPEVGAVV